ncbi:MAG: hypothetical protein ACREQI_16110 [Candidatus Binataceae bacterium]
MEARQHLEVRPFSKREIATVLAALRTYQAQLILNDGEPPMNVSDHFADVESMTHLEVDALCERINLRRIVLRPVTLRRKHTES